MSKCHDCKKEVKKEEAVVFNTTETGDKVFLKCEKCYEENPVLENFQETDVYSRVVGFHTPTKRWNKGKAEEWKDRKTFKVREDIEQYE